MVAKKKVQELKHEENKVDFSKIEKKWQNAWEKTRVFEVQENSKKKKFYVLEMYPYPSASFLHMGHVRNYTIGDIFARFKRMSGFNVLYPMGYDSFGLPAETSAKKEGIHPKKYTEESIKKIMSYQKALGNSYDWSRVIASHEPEYYKWNQYFFLKLFEKGLAYRKKASVNWCEKCQSVLANEEAEGGKCWRCGSEVIQKEMEQWFLKITAYADRLLRDLDKIEWPEKIKKMQIDWIGKSHGTEIDFEINKETWKIFTTRPDTIFGVTFVVVSSQHPRLMELVTSKQKKEVEKFLSKIKAFSQKSMKDLEELNKEGVFTGSYAINPLTKEKIPVWAGNFVLADYGSGMVMAVPTHDQRDFEFAKKYKIEMKQVIAPSFITTSGKDAVRKDKKTEERDSVFAIVKHWKEDKYFLLDWKKFGWKSFVIGGVDKGESFKDAAIREVKEETGYMDIKKITEIAFENHANFYAEHKGVNRYGRFRNFLIELKSDKRENLEEEHTKNHEGLWMDKNKVMNFINLLNNKYIWNIYLNGERAFTENGILINSDKFSGMENNKAVDEITKELEKLKLGKKTVNYKIRDWMISRQRYWGTPIPVIYCDKCGVVPVSEKDLPVLLPEKVDFKAAGNPLATNKEFLNVKCPKCGEKAKRETDTMGGFMDSSWYFLRYCDNKNKNQAFDKKKADYWMPVDQYIGGAEHAVMHLLYSRFFTKFLRDSGFVDFDEPFTNLFNQGIVYKGGAKMSKSKGNVVFQTDISNKYGIDTARLFLMSVASPEKQMEWSDEGVNGSFRFINKVFSILDKVKFGKDSKELEVKLNISIKNISEQITIFDYRRSTIELRELFDLISQQKEVSKESFASALKLLAPFCPHLTEEIWQKIGKNDSGKDFISIAEWPKYKEIKQKQVKEDISDKIIVNIKPIVEKFPDKKKVYLYVMPFEIKGVDAKKISKSIGKVVEIWAVNDPKKHDPENRAKKSIPGRPAIYFE